MSDTITSILVSLYGRKQGVAASRRLRSLMADFPGHSAPDSSPDLDQTDVVLITYPDHVTAPDEPPLRTLGTFLRTYARNMITTVHLLPFYPSSSDDGFSVMDYRAVDPLLGSWADIRKLRTDFRLMFDLVLNHASAQGSWFKSFLRNDPKFRSFFKSVEGHPDMSRVVRPRALPLVTEFSATERQVRVWTTFGPDQVDLDYGDPNVLLEIIEVLLGYVRQGADLLRLDAVAYLWKEVGTTCIHRPQTYQIVRLIRAIADELAPNMRLVTETNVPHWENVSYFGNGRDMAHLVYNFALPPLVLHAFLSSSSVELSKWISGLEYPDGSATYLNFLASHDGIGLSPLRGLLTETQVSELTERVRRGGGMLSERTGDNGFPVPYELNVNYLDALNVEHRSPPDIEVKRFLSAHAIMLALRGIPAIYFHSLFGSRGWPEGAARTGSKRSVNREKVRQDVLEAELRDPGTIRHEIFTGFAELLEARASSAAFHPAAGQKVLDAGSAVMALLRTSADGRLRVLCVTNVTDAGQIVSARTLRGIDWRTAESRDLIAGQRIPRSGGGEVRLAPYQTAWFAADER